jgi:hypothetical protein
MDAIVHFEHVQVIRYNFKPGLIKRSIDLQVSLYELLEFYRHSSKSV